MPRRSLLILLLLLVLAGGVGYALIGVDHVSALIGAPRQAGNRPIHLASGKGLYTLLLSARTVSGFTGELRIALEGAPGMNYSLLDLTPLLRPGQDPHPALHQDRLELPEADSRIELGIILQPKPPAPAEARANPYLPDCCRGAGQLDNSTLTTPADLDRPLHLSFYDQATGRLLLKIPILIGDRTWPEDDMNELFNQEPAAAKPLSARHG